MLEALAGSFRADTMQHFHISSSISPEEPQDVGLSMRTGQPTASAGDTLRVIIDMGKFHGVIAAVTLHHTACARNRHHETMWTTVRASDTAAIPQVLLISRGAEQEHEHRHLYILAQHTPSAR